MAVYKLSFLLVLNFQKRRNKMYDYDKGVMADCVKYFLIYGGLTLLILLSSVVVPVSAGFLFVFFGLLSVRLFSLGGDTLLQEKDREQENARMKKLLGRYWELKNFPVPAFVVALVIATTSRAFAIDDRVVTSGTPILVMACAIYIIYRKYFLYKP